METTNHFKGCITHGPWGGPDGKVWDYRPEGFIRKITVMYRDLKVVDCLEFHSNSSKGETQTSVFGKQCEHSQTYQICIDYPNEYLISISGTYGPYYYSEYDVVKSICFKTNQNLYGPFGHINSGSAFSHVVKEGEVIVGFHGRAATYINSIGVYVMPKSLSSSSPNSTNEVNTKTERLKMGMPREAGPWGACGGISWDDGVFSGIKQVRVHVGDLNVIYALEFEYLNKDGESVLSQIHGGTDGSKVEMVNLDGEDEFLIGIFGYFGPVEGYNGLEAISSISFHTNKRIHGPYGEEHGKGKGYVYYSSTASAGKVVGFHGRNDSFLSAIGVHMKYF